MQNHFVGNEFLLKVLWLLGVFLAFKCIIRAELNARNSDIYQNNPCKKKITYAII